MFSRITTSVSMRSAHLFFWVRSRKPVWLYAVNGKSRRAKKKNPTALSVVQQRIVTDLGRDGIAVAHLDEFFPARGLLENFQQYVADGRARAETRTHKSFLKNLWDAVPLVDFGNPFFVLALDDAILATVNEYMGLWSYFFYLTLNVTTPVLEGSEAVQSQRWHGDPEDRKMCKVFLYLTDVDEGSGPFTYVRGSQSGGRWRHLFREQSPRGIMPPERPIKEIVPSTDIMTCTGKAGTIIFCDTSGYHRGGYATKKERIMLTMGYCSGASPYPMRVRFSELLREQREYRALSPAARHALTFAPGHTTSYFFRKIKPRFKYGA
ncbi:MAG: phytanoyl-CoA dioxygenase family protein [bacterium]|nr:phytanoyl-CoA dioxygenase family protein [bacterium]MDZ4299398.1 hypothetical protein [Candidatus Sungbacteria bacterium]